ncbi:DUF4142 domain-containing protein [Asticcacaulis solisilvae]|uniref:DUF4142 domain-containing protein n=1 Tax=Asticcacaulis solisilvae TaxID=1217274 RepID=UPI003FD83CEA
MTTRKAHKITGILAAALAASALGTLPVGAYAQTTPATQPADQAPATAPAQAPAPTPASPPATSDATSSAATATAGQGTAGQGTGPVAKDFIQQAYLTNEFGIAAAQVALKTSSNAAVKAAAQSVLTDGMKVRQDMVAAIQGATTDMHFDQGWTDEYKQKLADLQSVTGKEFDQKYLATQGDVTKTAASAYSTYASAGTDATVKTFAQSDLPRLQADGSKLDAAASSVASEPDAAAAPATPTASKATKTVKHTKKK